MVVHLLRLRLDSIANRVRFGLRPAFQAVVTVLVVLVASILVASLVSLLRSSAPAETAAILTDGGALLLVAFAVFPFAATRPAWTDPRRLAGYGLSIDTAASGLALGGLIGLPTLGVVVLAIGYVRAWGDGAGVAWSAVLSAVLAGATAFLLGLVAATLNAQLTGRRSRQLLIVGGSVVALFLVPLVIDLVRLAMNSGDAPSGLSHGLAWTPFGAAAALPGNVASARTGHVVLGLLVSVATPALLWWAWRSLVRQALTRPQRLAVVHEREGLGWFDLTTATPAGAVAGRSLTYWARDSRYRWSLVVLPFLPLLVVPLGIAGIPWAPLALIPVPLMCLVLGFLPHNDVAYDNTALWMHVASNTTGLADRMGRLAPPLVIGLPVAAVGSIVAAWLHGDPSAFAPEFGVCVALLLSGLGLSSILSAALPYAAVRPGDDPFQQPQTTGGVAGVAQSILFGGALALSVPAGILGIRAVVGGESGLGQAALWVGIGTGVVVLVVGVLIGSRVFSRRAPELLAFALRS
ncbi:hypothetical protein [Frondihabitans cladoniiphilus]|uniref:ABC-2 type transport system permease protein n=1 Tax=Frondihabitans cladoniiphilus TaxID=715785 RepID=A0ABP8VTZ2_9MICO